MYKNQRQSDRVEVSLPIQISIGSQLTIQGKIKDLSDKSAFIIMKSSVYMELNEEIKFEIRRSSEDEKACVEGLARISRLAPGVGIAIYFTEMNEASSKQLDGLVNHKSGMDKTV